MSEKKDAYGNGIFSSVEKTILDEVLHVSVAKKDQLRMNLACQACCDSLFVVMSVVRGAVAEFVVRVFREIQDVKAPSSDLQSLFHLILSTVSPIVIVGSGRTENAMSGWAKNISVCLFDWTLHKIPRLQQ